MVVDPMRAAAAQGDITASVGLTALVVAAGRAMETHRTDGLISDPYAEVFVRAAAAPVPMPTHHDEDVTGFFSTRSVLWAVRSRFFDDYLAEAVGEGLRQVVLLAAGLDARAYRLDWPPHTDLYEIDQPEVLEFKQRVLTERGAHPGCQHHLVPIDLREDWVGALRAAGFTSARPTAWLAEGLLVYLPADAEEALFEHLHELSAPGSRLAFDVLTPEARAAITTHTATCDITTATGVNMPALWSHEPRRDCVTWLRSTGWDVTIRTRAEAADQYGREVHATAGLSGLGTLVTARLPRDEAVHDQNG